MAKTQNHMNKYASVGAGEKDSETFVKYANYDRDYDSDIYADLEKIVGSVDGEYTHFSKMASTGSKISKLSSFGISMANGMKKEAQMVSIMSDTIGGLIGGVIGALGVAYEVLGPMIENAIKSKLAGKSDVKKSLLDKIIDKIKSAISDPKEASQDDVDKAVDEAVQDEDSASEDTTVEDNVEDGGDEDKDSEMPVGDISDMPKAASVKIRKIKKS